MRYDPPSAVRRAALSHGALKRALQSAIFIASLTFAARAETNSQQLAGATHGGVSNLEETMVADFTHVFTLY